MTKSGAGSSHQPRTEDYGRQVRQLRAALELIHGWAAAIGDVYTGGRKRSALAAIRDEAGRALQFGPDEEPGWTSAELDRLERRLGHPEQYADACDDAIAAIRWLRGQ